MKKGQSGVSLIALVITIIVVIILAAIAFGTSTRTITNANWSTFTNAVGEVRTAMLTRTTTVKGEEAAKGTTRTDAQVYNFVAKDGASKSGDDYVSGDINMTWLSRDQAAGITATKIEDSVLNGTALNLRNRNKIKVNTTNRSGVEVSYYITREGEVFVWPPYEYENNYYVNANTTVSGDKVDKITFNSGLVVKISGDSETAPELKTANTGVKPQIDTATNAQNAQVALENIPTVIWSDIHGHNSVSPVGFESTAVYSSKGN